MSTQGWKRSIVWLAALAALVATAQFFVEPANAQVSPLVFEGRYALQRARFGLCDEKINVFTSSGDGKSIDLIMMRYTFVKINGGPRFLDDELESSVWESFTTDDFKIISRWRQFDKIQRAHNRSDTVASLTREGILTLRSVTSGVTGSTTECIYRRNSVL